MKSEYLRNQSEQARMRLEDKLQMLRRVESQLGSVTHDDTQVPAFMVSPSLVSSVVYAL